MALSFEDRRKYRELFWVDYHSVIKIFLSKNLEEDALFPNKNKRIAQILLVHFMPEMWRVVDSATPKSKQQFISEQASLHSRGVTWLVKKGKISLSLGAVTNFASKFILYWLYVTAKTFYYSFFPGHAAKATFFFDVTREIYFRHGSLESFKTFLRKGPIKAFREETHFMIQGKPEDSEKGFWFSSMPLLESVKIKSFNFLDPFALLAFQLKYLFIYLVYGLKDSKNWLLYKDMPFHGVAEFLSQNNFIQQVFKTPSGFQDHKLWLSDIKGKKFSTNMLWYSVNYKAFRYYPDQSHCVHPDLLTSRADINYVWNKDEAKFMKEMAPLSKVEIVEPILFYLPELKPILKATARDELNVVIFDVAPHVRSIYTPSFYSYHKTENCIKFIDDIDTSFKKVANELNFKFNIYLKPKRPPSKSHHDPKYFDFVDSKNYQKLETQANVFDLIDQADIVIVALYSSPMFIRKVNNCIYYDPTGDLINDYPDCPFAQTIEQLADLIKTKVRVKSGFISKAN